MGSVYHETDLVYWSYMDLWLIGGGVGSVCHETYLV